MRIEQHLEMTISESINTELIELLQHAFPSIYPNRRYFKQLPHLRLIAYEDEQIIGQVGLDFRVMNVDGEPIHVLGIIDLCVRKEVRGRGVGLALMEEVIALGEEYPIDFLLLFADRPDLYERIGFHTVSNTCTWLQIDDENQTTRGIGEASFDELMVRSVGDKKWTEGKLDLLGYLY
ncbi:GNAT family N-acetyltransferase [Exiguobacterium aestuarii]|uniref:GNAT family N-acetyltransferase n=1 Tax=Exiguobacterium aestuarii TaxID=273527 RepID=A0ABW2PHU7_9BACL|nr:MULTISPECIES: GNAT family N-acetyltransferase [Exiguobacterium]MCT4786983.1 GNAT family N-acetyltransferase [Exiguobacterium aestuarii]